MGIVHQGNPGNVHAAACNAGWAAGRHCPATSAGRRAVGRAPPRRGTEGRRHPATMAGRRAAHSLIAERSRPPPPATMAGRQALRSLVAGRPRSPPPAKRAHNSVSSVSITITSKHQVSYPSGGQAPLHPIVRSTPSPDSVVAMHLSSSPSPGKRCPLARRPILPRG